MITISCTFWIRRKKLAAELAKQQVPTETEQTPKEVKKSKKGGAKK